MLSKPFGAEIMIEDLIFNQITEAESDDEMDKMNDFASESRNNFHDARSKSGRSLNTKNTRSSRRHKVARIQQSLKQIVDMWSASDLNQDLKRPFCEMFRVMSIAKP